MTSRQRSPCTLQDNICSCHRGTPGLSTPTRVLRTSAAASCKADQVIQRATSIQNLQEEDARVLRGLTGNLEATSRAARAAVLESEAGPEAAKAAAERVYKEYALAHRGSAPDAQSAPAAEPATSSIASAGSQAAGEFPPSFSQHQLYIRHDVLPGIRTACTLVAREVSMFAASEAVSTECVDVN